MYFVKKGCVSAFKGDFTLKGMVFSLMPLQFVCMSKLAPKIEPQLRGEEGGLPAGGKTRLGTFFQ